MTYTHLYKKRIGPWGLVARISLDVAAMDEAPSGARRVEGGAAVWWVPPRGMVAEDERWMAFGLGLVAGQLDAVRGGSPALVVTVVEWDVPMLTDYQEEVAAAAVIACLQEGFGIEGVATGLAFDRERNRYTFTWGGQQERRA
ncbi:hypothetical protein [Streptomyces sp. NPDC049813]|uniref:hypothetical protein n=1 Tax=Streptomyces sp. NPDC049813 TaxID=3365597 RepID=UPI00378817CE